jgi:molecular chaperone HtpG
MMVDVPAPVEPDESADSEEAKSEPKAPKMIKEDQTLNTMVPLWKRQKSELTDEDYNSFYKGKFYDPEDPARVIHTSVEGVSSFTALMFIPKKAPFNYYTRDFRKGLQLYSSGVLIMDRCEELVPDYFSFVRGLVDSQDLSLNISREMLQHDRQLKNIAKNITRKIRNELADFLKNDREGYEAFYENFGPQLKFGMYQDFGLHKGDLEDLVMYYSSSEKKMVTLAEYVERMPEDQTHIYYAAGDSIEHIDRMPRTEALKEKGTEILYVTDDIDEFVFQTVGSYKEKTFLSVKQDDPAAEQDEAAKEALEKKEEEYKDLLAAIKASLGDKVSEVKLTDRLAEHPVCLTTKGGLSLEMERVLNAAPAGEAIKAERVLEINADHEILDVLKAAQAEDKEEMDTYAQLLYDQALLIEGMPIDDPVRFSTEVCKLMK